MDWASVGSFPTPEGEAVKVHAFVMVLGFSRMLYVEFTTSMELPVFLACHQHAFAFFGGWPKELLYDNMAQVKLIGSPEWNPLFRDFVAHCGVTPRLCRVRRPRTKGKVERAIGYLQENFLAGRTFADAADLNAQGLHWLLHTANVRTHATTGQRPVDLLPKEGLTPLSQAVPYRRVPREVRKVSAEGYVHLAGSRYSVAPEHVGKTVVVEVGEQRVCLRAGDLLLAEHPRAAQPGACVADPEHVAACWQLCLPPGKADPASPGHPPEGKGDDAPPSSRPWQLAFTEGVATTPLSVYDQHAVLATVAGAAEGGS